MPKRREPTAAPVRPREPKSRTLHLRVTAGLDERLRFTADRQNEKPAVLAERLLEEGLRQSEHPLVRFEAGAFGRRAMLVGSRLDVPTVIETLRQNGGSIPATASYLNQSVAAVDACAAYYADYQDEIDRWIDLTREVTARLAERRARRREADV